MDLRIFSLIIILVGNVPVNLHFWQARSKFIPQIDKTVHQDDHRMWISQLRKNLDIILLHNWDVEDYYLTPAYAMPELSHFIKYINLSKFSTKTFQRLLVASKSQENSVGFYLVAYFSHDKDLV